MTKLDELKEKLRRGYLRQYLEASGFRILKSGKLKCPNAVAHRNGDNDPSAQLYEEDPNDHVHCYGCGKHWDIFDMCEMVEGIDFKAALKSLASRFRLEYPGADATGSAKAKRSAQSAVPSASYFAPVRSAADDKYLAECAARIESPEAVAYLEKRGISLETARRLDIGFDTAVYFTKSQSKKPAIIFPSAGGWAARSVEGKYHHFKSGTSGCFFNGEALCSTDPTSAVFLVEGQFDASSIEEVGGHAVAIGGMYNLTAIIEALKSKKPNAPVIIALDHEDDAKKAETIAKARQELEDGLCAAGVFVYTPDDPENVFGAHDANDALCADREKFASTIRQLEFQASEAFVRRDEKPAEKSQWDEFIFSADKIPPPVPEEDNPRALFKGGFMRKGQVMTIVSVPGVGKSVLANQCALSWAAGYCDVIGLEPVAGRKLRTLIIQFEDDKEEMSDFFVDYRAGFKRNGWYEDELSEALQRLDILDVRKLRLKKKCSLTDDEFATVLSNIQHERKYDIVILNPLTSCLAEYDLGDNRDANTWLRQKIQPVIENPETECGLVFIHHTSKVPKDKKSIDEFLSGSYAQFAAQGAAALMNFTRASLIVAPVKDHPEDFKLVAAKRGRKLGWKDADGKPALEKYISYSPDIKFWISTPTDRLAKLEESATKTGGGKPAFDAAGEADKYAAQLRALPQPITATEAGNRIRSALGSAKGNMVWKLITKNPSAYKVTYLKCGKTEYYGGPAQLAIGGST